MKQIEKTYDIGIILINYNTSKHTINCINSILKYTPQNINIKIVIVDNNSNYSDYETLESFSKNESIELIRNKYNYGFSTANMIALNRIKSKYYFFLNNDTEFLNDCCTILMSYMDKNAAAGIVSGQMFNPDGSLGINFNYIPDLKLKLLGSAFLRIFNPADYPKKGISYTSPLQVKVLNGSSLFVRADVFNDIGGFDTTFFLYCEEEDLAIRMGKKGYSCFLIPEAKYKHIQGASSSSDEKMKYTLIKEFYISQNYLYLKHFGLLSNFVWRITQFFRMSRKVFIHTAYFKIALLILFNTGFKNSMRLNQKINN